MCLEQKKLIELKELKSLTIQKLNSKGFKPSIFSLILSHPCFIGCRWEENAKNLRCLSGRGKVGLF